MIVVFDETTGRASPGASSMRGSRLEEGWDDRERQRQDQDPRLRPTKPELQGASFEETEATGSSGRTMLSSSGRYPRGHLCDPCRSWRLAVKRGSTRSSPPPRFRPGVGHGAWKPPSSAKAGGEGDSRIERSNGCSLCKSVADAGKNASSPAGRSRPQGRERRRRVSSTRRLHVDSGGAARSGRKGAG